MLEVIRPASCIGRNPRVIPCSSWIRHSRKIVVNFLPVVIVGNGIRRHVDQRIHGDHRIRDGSGNTLTMLHVGSHRITRNAGTQDAFNSITHFLVHITNGCQRLEQGMVHILDTSLAERLELLRFVNNLEVIEGINLTILVSLPQGRVEIHGGVELLDDLALAWVGIGLVLNHHRGHMASGPRDREGNQIPATARERPVGRVGEDLTDLLHLVGHIVKRIHCPPERRWIRHPLDGGLKPLSLRLVAVEERLEHLPGEHPRRCNRGVIGLDGFGSDAGESLLELGIREFNATARNGPNIQSGAKDVSLEGIGCHARDSRNHWLRSIDHTLSRLVPTRTAVFQLAKIVVALGPGGNHLRV